MAYLPSSIRSRTNLDSSCSHGVWLLAKDGCSLIFLGSPAEDSGSLYEARIEQHTDYDTSSDDRTRINC
jgi:hypothetical protein